MSADHRKPVVAFVLLAVIATALIFVQRAEAQSARFFAAFIAGAGETQGTGRLPEEILGNAGWWEERTAVAGDAAAGARGGAADDPAHQPATEQSDETADLHGEAGERSRGRHDRPSVGNDPSPGSEVAEAARRSGGPRALEKAEKDVLQDIHQAERSLRSSRRSADHLPTGTRRASSHEVDRGEGIAQVVESRDEDELLDR